MVLIQLNLPKSVDKFIKIKQALVNSGKTKENILIDILKEYMEKENKIKELIEDKEVFKLEVE